MIGQLRGALLSKQAPNLVLDVGGVGYEVEAPMSTFYALPATGSETTLYTHMVIREDQQLLFGFASVTERTLFRNLIRVNGVGPKLALMILSGMSVEAFVRCVNHKDTAALTCLPGVGKKTAERLIVEMHDRLSDWLDEKQVAPLRVAANSGQGLDHPVNDALSGLVSLGYKPKEARNLVQSVETTGLNSEEIIRRALQASVR